MNDELTTTDPQEPEEVVEETTPEEDPTAKREAQLKAWEKELQKKSTELGLSQKQLEERLAALEQKKPAEEEDDDFDPEQLKVFRKALKKIGLDPDALSTTVATITQRQQEEMSSVYQDFFTEHADVEQEAVLGFLDDMGVRPPSTPAQLKKVLATGYKAYKAANTDLDALAAEKLAALQQDGEKVVRVQPKRSGVSDGKRSLDDILADDTIGFWEKQRALDELDSK